MPRKNKSLERSHDRAAGAPQSSESEVRIIGGNFRGRRLRYHGDPVVRPMKHRVREAIFNLISTDVTGCHAIDLFAGTGALGLEAISRGARQVTLIEKHVPTARLVEENIQTLQVADRATLCVTSAFLWAKRDLPALSQPHTEPRSSNLSSSNPPWLIFCSPPYEFFVTRQDEMLDLIRRVREYAPPESMLVVESDDRLDLALLGENWDIRPYPPAIVSIWRK